MHQQETASYHGKVCGGAVHPGGVVGELVVEGAERVLVVVSGKELVAIVGGEEEEDDGDEDEGGDGGARPVALGGRLFVHGQSTRGGGHVRPLPWMRSSISQAAGDGCPSRPPSSSPSTAPRASGRACPLFSPSPCPTPPRFQDFAECFPTYVEKEEKEAQIVFKLTQDYIEKQDRVRAPFFQPFSAADSSQDDIIKLFQKYLTDENVDIPKSTDTLHKLVREAEARKERGEISNSVWREDRRPKNACMTPSLEAQAAQLRQYLAKVSSPPDKRANA